MRSIVQPHAQCFFQTILARQIACGGRGPRSAIDTPPLIAKLSVGKTLLERNPKRWQSGVGHANHQA